MGAAKLLQNVLPFTRSREDAGRVLVDKLRYIRRTLSPSERAFEEIIKEAEIAIAYQASLSPEQQIESVLRAVAVNEAHTIPEIAEDVGLSQADTRLIVAALLENGSLEIRERYAVGNTRQILYWVKSTNRKSTNR